MHQAIGKEGSILHRFIGTVVKNTRKINQLHNMSSAHRLWVILAAVLSIMCATSFAQESTTITRYESYDVNIGHVLSNYSLPLAVRCQSNDGIIEEHVFNYGDSTYWNFGIQYPMRQTVRYQCNFNMGKGKKVIEFPVFDSYDIGSFCDLKSFFWEVHRHGFYFICFGHNAQLLHTW